MKKLSFLLLFSGCIVMEIDGTYNGTESFSIDATQSIEKLKQTWCLDANSSGTIANDRINRLIDKSIYLKIEEVFPEYQYKNFQESYTHIDIDIYNNKCYFQTYSSGKIEINNKTRELFAYSYIFYEISFEEKKIKYYGTTRELILENF